MTNANVGIILLVRIEFLLDILFGYLILLVLHNAHDAKHIIFEVVFRQFLRFQSALNCSSPIPLFSLINHPLASRLPSLYRQLWRTGIHRLPLFRQILLKFIHL